MAFFKFRKTGASQDAPRPPGETAAPSETVEGLRRRALYRLIGAAVLVLIAIIGFPMLFDTQPRPTAVQAPIVIPDRNAVPPLALPASAAAIAPALLASPQVPASTSLAAGEEIVSTSSDKSISGAIAPAASSVTPAAQTAQDEGVRAEQQVARQQIVKQQAAKRAAEQRKVDQAKTDQAKRQRSQAADAARARALLDGGNTVPASSTTARATSAHGQEGRYAIQIGAFATAQAAQAARQKAERAGVKTYTQTIATSAGPRTRVRVGPFTSRDEAQRALAKLKQAGLTGSVLSP
jgi:DedD protein